MTSDIGGIHSFRSSYHHSSKKLAFSKLHFSSLESVLRKHDFSRSKISMLSPFRVGVMAPRPSTSGDGNRSRRRAREELESLRTIAHQLEDELARLRDVGRAASGAYATMDEEVKGTKMEAAWRRIALELRTRRFESEAENARLREAIASRLRVVNTLNNVCEKSNATLRSAFGRRSQELDERMPNVQCQFWFRTELTEHCGTDGEAPRIVADFERVILRTSLQGLLTKTDHFFSYAPFTVNSRAFRSIDIQYNEAHGAFVAASERRLLPFDRDLVADATMMLSEGSVKVSELEKVVVTDYTVVEGGTVVEGRMRSEVVIRRLDVDDEIIFAFTCLSEPYCYGNVGEIYTRCYGLRRMRTLPLPSDASRTITEVLTHMEIIPEVHTRIPDQNRKVATFNKFVKATIGYQMDTYADAADNWMLDRSQHCRRD